MNRQTANKYRQRIEQAAVSLSDKDALEAVELFPRWKNAVRFEAGERVCYNGKLYSVLISHTTQSDWSPDISPSLFAEVLIPDPDKIYDWQQPDSTNLYMKGDKVRHNSKIWVSNIDNNSWEPGVYGWDEIE